jgi:hypothetical protein
MSALPSRIHILGWLAAALSVGAFGIFLAVPQMKASLRTTIERLGRAAEIQGRSVNIESRAAYRSLSNEGKE